MLKKGDSPAMAKMRRQMFICMIVWCFLNFSVLWRPVPRPTYQTPVNDQAEIARRAERDQIDGINYSRTQFGVWFAFIGMGLIAAVGHARLNRVTPSKQTLAT